MRVKCRDTPGGVISAISGSTVGLPGGTINPIRVRHPFTILAPSCLWSACCEITGYVDDLVPQPCRQVANARQLFKPHHRLQDLVSPRAQNGTGDAAEFGD